MTITTRAPYRIFDCGGWTDTSFMPGGEGNVCNVAIALYVRVTYKPDESNRLIIHHGTGGRKESLTLPLSRKPKTLAEAAVMALKLNAQAGGEVTITSEVPPGSGLGGSASCSVALLAALNPKLLDDKHNLAALAQSLETKWLGHSCGTQDQMAAAFGGISASSIKYPDFTHEAIPITGEIRSFFQDELLLVYTGEAHFSSKMHQTVVNELEKENVSVVAAFHTLRECALRASEAIKHGYFTEYKTILNDNWEAQKRLHPGITTEAIEALHKTVLQIDPTAGFKGCGAGGGGSVAILVAPDKKETLMSAIRNDCPTMMVWDNKAIDELGATIL